MALFEWLRTFKNDTTVVSKWKIPKEIACFHLTHLSQQVKQKPELQRRILATDPLWTEKVHQTDITRRTALNFRVEETCSTWTRAATLYDTQLQVSIRTLWNMQGVCGAQAGVRVYQRLSGGRTGEVKLYYLQIPNPSPVRHYTATIRSFTYYQPLHYNGEQASRARPRNAHLFQRPSILQPQMRADAWCPLAYIMGKETHIGLFRNAQRTIWPSCNWRQI